MRGVAPVHPCQSMFAVRFAVAELESAVAAVLADPHGEVPVVVGEPATFVLLAFLSDVLG